jgi:nitrate reductase gamma subunit
MHAFEIAVTLAVLAVAAFQIWLTRRVFKSNLYERKQKIWQAQLIWLLPIIGSGLVFTILQQDAKAEREASTLSKF